MIMVFPFYFDYTDILIFTNTKRTTSIFNPQDLSIQSKLYRSRL